MGHRTIPVSEVHRWAFEARTDRATALKKMSGWITQEIVMRASSLPDMLATAHHVSISRSETLRVPQTEQVAATYLHLHSEYLARRGATSVVGYTKNKLQALARFSVETKITELLPLYRLYLCRDGGLRISLPSTMLATINRRCVALSLYYDDVHPIYLGEEVTDAGQNILGAINLGLLDREAVDEHGDTAIFPTDPVDAVLLDISKQRKDAPVRTYYQSRFGGLFLAHYKDTFRKNLDVLSVLYREACAEIGFDPATGKKIGEPPVVTKSKPRRRAA